MNAKRLSIPKSDGVTYDTWLKDNRCHGVSYSSSSIVTIPYNIFKMIGSNFIRNALSDVYSNRKRQYCINRRGDGIVLHLPVSDCMNVFGGGRNNQAKDIANIFNEQFSLEGARL